MSINGNLVQAARQLGSVQFGTPATKSAARLSAAGTLVQSIAKSGDEDAEDKAKSLFDAFKESIELGNGLERAAQDSQDAMRKQKIELMAKRIEQLKELLRFATPEQAKRMLKELKQLSREFKSVSQELGKSSEGLAPATSGSALQSTSFASSVTATANLAESSPSNAGPTHATTPTPPEYTPATDPSSRQGTFSEDADAQPAWQIELSEAISSYTQTQLDSEQTHSVARRQRLQQDKEDLGKIASSMKQLADALERLAKDDDKASRKDLKDIRANLEDGLDELKGADLSGGNSLIPGSLTGVSAPATPGGSLSFQTTNILI